MISPSKIAYKVMKGAFFYSPIFGGVLLIFANRKKEGFSHQLRSKSETIGEGIALDDAVHLVHAFLELFECFLLLFRERAVQFFTIPGDQLQQFLEPLVTSRALLEG